MPLTWLAWITLAYAASNVLACVMAAMSDYSARPDPARWVLGLCAIAALLGG